MFARMLVLTTPASVVPPTMIASGPETTGAPPCAGTGRSLTARCFHSAIVPSLDGVAQ